MYLIFNIMFLLCNIGVCTYVRSIADNLDERIDELSMIEYRLASKLTECEAHKDICP